MSDEFEGLWAKCQIRLYDDNDENDDNPEVPHTYTDKDHFLVGIFIYEEYENFDPSDLDRAGLIDFLEAGGTTRMLRGRADTPDPDLEEIDLIETQYQDAMFGGRFLVYNHRYHIFEPRLPGTR